MINVLIYSSTMLAGKTEVSNHLMEKYGYTRIKMAQTLKEMLAVLIGKFVPDPWEYLEGSKKEEIVPGLMVTGRYLMQTIGHDWGRQMIGSHIWRIIACREINKVIPFSPIVVDDVRYKDEIATLVTMGFTAIKLVGRGELTRNHSSEGNLDDHPFDHIVHNDGTLEDLYQKIDNIIGEEF